MIRPKPEIRSAFDWLGRRLWIVFRAYHEPCFHTDFDTALVCALEHQ